ncbi:DUF3304 domain-containing protein [Burkholderia plantarii]|uniref:DUF3304 domain-containing protein n=1 Tax=Burkholderia plantarii TaxID=41899 RepID=UPI001495DC4C|nr:DUF3304 domain-containing protein [Burkholderia plantarii]
MACSDQDESSPSSVSGYNYTEYYIGQFGIENKDQEFLASGPNIFPKERGEARSGGRASVCCIGIPAHWRPGLKLVIRWRRDTKPYDLSLIHIDVYKRQAHWRPGLKLVIRWRRDTKPYDLSLIHIDVYKRQAHWRPGLKLVIRWRRDTKPYDLSLIHIDVYKRQAHWRPGLKLVIRWRRDTKPYDLSLIHIDVYKRQAHWRPGLKLVIRWRRDTKPYDLSLIHIDVYKRQAHWRPGLKLVIRWRRDTKPYDDDRSGDQWLTASTDVPPYGPHNYGFWVHFLPDDRIRVEIQDRPEMPEKPADNDPYIVQGVLDPELNKK